MAPGRGARQGGTLRAPPGTMGLLGQDAGVMPAIAGQQVALGWGDASVHWASPIAVPGLWPLWPQPWLGSGAPEPPRTTMMLKGMPAELSRDAMLLLLDERGFSGHYDFAYVPIDFATQVSFGYSLINFVSLETADRFQKEFHGFASWPVASEKVGEVSRVEDGGHQGREENIARYRNSAMMHQVVPDEFKPALFVEGARVAFPKPTARIRPPKGVPPAIWKCWTEARRARQAERAVQREAAVGALDGRNFDSLAGGRSMGAPPGLGAARGLFCAPAQGQLSSPARSWRLAVRSAMCLDQAERRTRGLMRRPDLPDRWENAAWRIWVQNPLSEGGLEQKSMRLKFAALSSLECLFCGPHKTCSCLHVAEAGKEALPHVLGVRVGAQLSTRQSRTGSVGGSCPPGLSPDEFFREGVLDTPVGGEEDVGRIYAQWQLLNMLSAGESWHRFRLAGYRLWRRFILDEAHEEDKEWWPRTPSDYEYVIAEPGGSFDAFDIFSRKSRTLPPALVPVVHSDMTACPAWAMPTVPEPLVGSNLRPQPRRLPVEKSAVGLAQWLQMSCDVPESEATAYAETLTADGFEVPEHLADMADDEWPSMVKKGHLRRIRRALAPQATPFDIGRPAHVRNERVAHAADGGSTLEVRTLSQIVATIRAELALDDSLTMSQVVAEANLQLGLPATGTLAKQASTLLRELVPT